MTHPKQRLKDEIETAFAKQHPGLTDHDYHMLSKIAAEKAWDALVRSAEEKKELYDEIVLKYEQNRTSLNNLLEELKIRSSKLYRKFYQTTDLQWIWDKKKQGPKVIGNKPATEALAEFMNWLGEEHDAMYMQVNNVPDAEMKTSNARFFEKFDGKGND